MAASESSPPSGHAWAHRWAQANGSQRFARLTVCVAELRGARAVGRAERPQAERRGSLRRPRLRLESLGRSVDSFGCIGVRGEGGFVSGAVSETLVRAVTIVGSGATREPRDAERIARTEQPPGGATAASTPPWRPLIAGRPAKGEGAGVVTRWAVCSAFGSRNLLLRLANQSAGGGRLRGVQLERSGPPHRRDPASSRPERKGHREQRRRQRNRLRRAASPQPGGLRGRSCVHGPVRWKRGSIRTQRVEELRRGVWRKPAPPALPPARETSPAWATRLTETASKEYPWSAAAGGEAAVRDLSRRRGGARVPANPHGSSQVRSCRAHEGKGRPDLPGIAHASSPARVPRRQQSLDADGTPVPTFPRGG